MNNIILFILLGMVIYFWNSIEAFSDKDDLDFVKSLQRFIDNEVTYSEYVRFLDDYDDKYKKLESVDKFKILKYLRKNNELSVDTIINFMN